MTNPRMTTKLGAALRAALLLLALTASNASAQRVCERPASETGRTCTIDECIQLQQVVHDYCHDAGAPADCSTLLLGDCQGLLEAKEGWEACRDARIEINDFCWSGGDASHILPVANAGLQIRTCEERLSRECSQPCP